MNHFKDIINSYSMSNVSAIEAMNAISNLYPAMDKVEEQNPKCFWKAMRGFHEHICGKHFNEMYAKYQVSEMYHTKRNGTICKGEIYSIEDIKPIYEKYVRNLHSSYTCWDVYVALNAQYHDYAKLYNEWYSNLSKEDLDNKIVSSGINFWFKDEDADTEKVWNYFKTID